MNNFNLIGKLCISLLLHCRNNIEISKLHNTEVTKYQATDNILLHSPPSELVSQSRELHGTDGILQGITHPNY